MQQLLTRTSLRLQTPTPPPPPPPPPTRPNQAHMEGEAAINDGTKKQEEKKKKRLMVLYPSPGMGHLVSMIELGKLFVRHGLSVSIVIVDPPYNTGATASFLSSVSSANPSISFHRLPHVPLPPNPSPHPEALAFDLLRLSNPHLLSLLRSLSPPSPRALVLDFFCTAALDVAAELALPAYFFFTSGASVLAVFLHCPALHDRSTKSFGELGPEPLLVPGVPPLPADHMPLPMLDRADEAYAGFLGHFRRLPDSEGIIVNTFRSLEPRAVEALSAGLCVPEGRRSPAPPIYCIGPLVKSGDGSRGRGEGCLAWLDAQPKASVVFLCFGSIGLFSAAQLQELAMGLEKSGHGFVWVVRSPPSDDPAKRFSPPPEPDLEKLLPEGFLDRTRGRGLVVQSWAPQKEVLAHESVGGFVTHCGWNSVLEAICGGVPMIAWPLYAEQRMNKVLLVEEMRLAVAVEGYDRELVGAEEVEAKVRWLMETEGGRELRERTIAARERAREAAEEGGESHAALMQLVQPWMNAEDQAAV